MSRITEASAVIALFYRTKGAVTMKININGKYKSLANYVTIRRRKDGVIILNSALVDEEIDITERQARYLKMLNGDRNPMKISGYSSEECSRYYQLFDEMMVLREPGRCQKSGFSVLYTLFIPQRLKKTKSVLPKILNFLMYTSCIPVFVIGLIKFIDGCTRVEYDHVWFGYICGLFIGMVMHELSHANACLAYGGSWLELGLMWSGLFPGAYVMLDTSKVKKRLRKAQINLAGVEMNLLLAGIFFMLAVSQSIWFSPLGEYTGAFFYAGFQNVFLALLNMTFFQGLDGEHTISNLLGKESIVKEAKDNILAILDFRKSKKYWQEHGKTNGLANICTDAFILCSQLVFPLLILSDIGIILGGVFG